MQGGEEAGGFHMLHLVPHVSAHPVVLGEGLQQEGRSAQSVSTGKQECEGALKSRDGAHKHLNVCRYLRIASTNTYPPPGNRICLYRAKQKPPRGKYRRSKDCPGQGDGMVYTVSTPGSSQGDKILSAESQVKYRNDTEEYLWEKNVLERGKHK